MNFTTLIHGTCNRTIRITESSSEDQYLTEEETPSADGRFAVINTAAIDILQEHSLHKITYPDYVIQMRDSVAYPTELKVKHDSWYTVIHIVLPKLDYVKSELEKEESFINNYKYIYCTDGKDVYQVIDKEFRVVKLTDIPSITDGSTISRCDTDIVYIGYILDKFNDSWIEWYDNRLQNGNCDSSICLLSQLLAMINLVKHNVMHNYFAEADRVLKGAEQLYMKKSKKDNHYKLNNDCGCH